MHKYGLDATENAHSIGRGSGLVGIHIMTLGPEGKLSNTFSNAGLNE